MHAVPSIPMHACCTITHACMQYHQYPCMHACCIYMLYIPSIPMHTCMLYLGVGVSTDAANTSMYHLDTLTLHQLRLIHILDTHTTHMMLIRVEFLENFKALLLQCHKRCLAIDWLILPMIQWSEPWRQGTISSSPHVVHCVPQCGCHQHIDSVCVCVERGGGSHTHTM